MEREPADDIDSWRTATPGTPFYRGTDAFVAGTGSFAAEMADWARAAGLSLVGLVEMVDEARVGSSRLGLPVVALRPAPPGAAAVLGIGGDRRASWEPLEASGWSALTVVHPAALLAADVDLERGAMIGPRAVLGAATTVGEQALVSRGALVGHHVRVGPFATLGPGVNVGGNTEIGPATFVGMGATIVNGVSVGEGAVIAAGAVVLRDVPPGARVQGIPARVVERSLA